MNVSTRTPGIHHRFQRRLAQLIRRIPGLVLLVYYTYRIIQPRYTIGVTGVVFNDEGRVLLVEHVFHPQLPWGLPGGWIGNNEHPARAVQRELREELALEVEVKTLIRAEKTARNHLDMAFLCQATNDIGNLSFELVGYRWYDTAEMPRLHSFHYHAIMQAKTLREMNYVPTG